MDTPVDEQQRFEHVTSLISASFDGVSKPGCLALEVLEQVCFFSSVSFVIAFIETNCVLCLFFIFIILYLVD